MQEMAKPAANHLRNASDSALFGLETFGRLIFNANANRDHELDRGSMADLGPLITHLAIEAQAMQQTDFDLRFVLAERTLKVVGGKA